MFVNNQSLLFIGDSITDTSRSRPIGKAVFKDTGIYTSTGLGSGYVSIINNHLIAKYPALNLTLLNQGINGNRVTDLDKRWQKDVIDQKPDWLTILIGINDVWHQFDKPEDPHQVLIEEYELTYRRIIESSKVKADNLILMSPFLLETDQTDPMRMKMIEYGKVVKAIATDYQCLFIDLQKAFDQFLECRPLESISLDKVHMNKAGHTIIAQTYLQAIESHLP